MQAKVELQRQWTSHTKRERALPKREWLVNVENKDFLNRYTIEQRLGLPITKVNDTGVFTFDENKLASVIDSSGKEFDLPDKMPTPRQDLYQAIEYNQYGNSTDSN